MLVVRTGHDGAQRVPGETDVFLGLEGRAFQPSFDQRKHPASGPPRRPRQSEFGIAEAFDVVAEGGGLFEIEVRGRGAHVFLELRDIGVELLLVVEPFGAVDGAQPA